MKILVSLSAPRKPKLDLSSALDQLGFQNGHVSHLDLTVKLHKKTNTYPALIGIGDSDYGVVPDLLSVRTPAIKALVTKEWQSIRQELQNKSDGASEEDGGQSSELREFNERSKKLGHIIILLGAASIALKEADKAAKTSTSSAKTVVSLSAPKAPVEVRRGTDEEIVQDVQDDLAHYLTNSVARRQFCTSWRTGDLPALKKALSNFVDYTFK